MSTEEGNVAVTYEGDNFVTIVNGRPTEITDVRVTHFVKDKQPAQIFIKDKMAPNEEESKQFHSTDGHDDHWAVTFQIGPNGYMSKDLKANMAAKESYILTIGTENLLFEREDHERDHRSHITYIYDCIKS